MYSTYLSIITSACSLQFSFFMFFFVFFVCFNLDAASTSNTNVASTTASSNSTKVQKPKRKQRKYNLSCTQFGQITKTKVTKNILSKISSSHVMPTIIYQIYKLGVKQRRFKKIAWIRSHHLHFQGKFKLLAEKFT